MSREPINSLKERVLDGGANGLIVGGYLTTPENPLKEDFKMLQAAGYDAGPKSHL